MLELNQLVSGYGPEKIPTSHPHFKFIKLANAVKWLRYAECGEVIHRKRGTLH